MSKWQLKDSNKHGEIGEDSKATPEKVVYQYMAKIQN